MMPEDHSGEVLDERYRLVRKLAEGGMGAVYLAEHEAIGGKLAVKLLRPELAEIVLFLKRFKREAMANAAIRHRNIVKVFDAGVALWGEPYMVMEYLEGESLRDLLSREGPLPLKAAVDLTRQALEGLAAAHAAGIVHRDLKPENLILVYEGGDDPTVKIIDFGISKFAPDQAQELTWSGVVLGTARYMSPEQAEGRDDIDPRTDLYSMGVVLYHALTGAFPHDPAAMRRATLAEALRQPPTPPAEHCAGFPEAVSRVVLKALAPDREERYQGALEMAAALAALDVSGECARRPLSLASRSDLRPVSGDLGEVEGARADGGKPDPGPAFTAREWIPGTRPPLPRRHRRIALMGALAALLGLAALGLTGVLHLPIQENQGVRHILNAQGAASGLAAPPAARGKDPAAPAAQEGVQVTVEGAPEGSRVFWDGVVVPMNPFRVDRRDTIVPLRVEADGYETFGIAVLPSADQVVRVAMVRASAPKTPRAGGGERGSVLDRGSASTGGKRVMDAQQAVVARNKPELKRCYDQALARGDAPRELDLVVHFRLDVGPSGRVTEASLTGNGAAVAPFAQCLEREVRGWFFLPVEEKESVVSFSFAFTTGG